MATPNIPDEEVQKLITILRTLANELERGDKTTAAAVAWAHEPQPGVLTHGVFCIHSQITTTVQLNHWRAEASRIMRLMDKLDDSVRRSGSAEAKPQLSH
jgi:hypothetical protein